MKEHFVKRIQDSDLQFISPIIKGYSFFKNINISLSLTALFFKTDLFLYKIDLKVSLPTSKWRKDFNVNVDPNSWLQICSNIFVVTQNTNLQSSSQSSLH